MDADERDICNYLKSWPGQFVSGSEIARRAGGKRRYREEPSWSIQVLIRLVEKGLVESDSTGHYRLRKRTENKQPKQWLSPHVRRILEDSGKFKDTVITVDDATEDDDVLK
jgi:hypothetical protein